MTLWFATGNAHKKLELSAILASHRLRTPDEIGLAFAPEETGATFLDNALLKARALFALVGEPVVADDSGLCVDALGGRPGVLSARYGSEDGVKLDSAARNALLLREVGAAPDRRARFVCALAAVFSPDRFYVVQETLEGVLLTAPSGSGGFGYDPILYLPDQGCSVAELGDETKNRLSHRAKAGRALAALLASEA